MLDQARAHRLQATGMKGHMVEHATSRFRHLRYAHDMQHWLVPGVKPEPGNREGRARPLNQTQHLNIEIPCRLQLVRDNSEVVHAQDHVEALDCVIELIINYCSYSRL
ncbi:hypothetical protein D9M71_819780 [compost metagenome]